MILNSMLVSFLEGREHQPRGSDLLSVLQRHVSQKYKGFTSEPTSLCLLSSSFFSLKNVNRRMVNE